MRTSKNTERSLAAERAAWQQRIRREMAAAVRAWMIALLSRVARCAARPRLALARREAEPVMRAPTIGRSSFHARCSTAAALLGVALTAKAAAAPAARAQEATRTPSRDATVEADRTDRAAAKRKAAENRAEPEIEPEAAIETEAEEAEIDGPRQVVRAPAIGAVLAAAYASAGLDRDPKDSWLRRARLGGLVPWVTVRTTRDTSWQDDSSEVGHGTTLELRATWRLDRLVFDAKELQVAAVEAARRRERRRLASRVIRAYFTWRRAASIVGGDDRVATRVAEAAAELDALTDGWFSEQLARRAPGSGGGSGKPRGAPPNPAAPGAAGGGGAS